MPHTDLRTAADTHHAPPTATRWLAPLTLAVALAAAAMAGCQPASSQGTAGASAPAAGASPAGGGSPGAGGGNSGPVTVGVVTLQTQRVSLSTELPGRVSAPQVAEVRPQVRGIVRSRNFTEGALVKAGQVLYTIEPDTYRVAVASAQAALAKAQATADAARLTAQRRSELLKVDAVSQQDQQDAQTALKQAEADVAAARAALDAASLNLQRTSVTAPISGRVDVSTVTVGALVTADQATALTTVRQLDPVQVDISQSSAELLRLRREISSGRLKPVEGDSAKVKLLLEDGSVLGRTGTLRFAGVAVNANTGAVTLRAAFDNADGVLLPGMYVRAVLETGVVERGLVVPQQALQRDTRGAATVLVVGADHKVQKRPVTAGRAFGSGWLVSDGLQDGEQVVVEGGQKVKPGDSVQTREADLNAAPTGGQAASAAARAASR